MDRRRNENVKRTLCCDVSKTSKVYCDTIKRKSIDGV